MPIYGSTPLTGVKEFTANLAQAAATYDLCAASGDVHIDLSQIAVYVATVGATFTSVSIQTDQTTPTIILTAAEGAVASVLAQKNLVRAIVTPSMTLRSGQKIQFSLIGLTGTGSLRVTIPYTSVTTGATLI